MYMVCGSEVCGWYMVWWAGGVMMVMMIANADGDNNDQMGLPTESAQVGRLID